ncbi:MAG: hypothetical protein QXI15_07935 [Zestosphaera sp.]
MSGSGDSVAEGKAENLPPTVLDSLRVVGFEEEFNQVLSDVMRVDYVKLPIHRAVYVEGYYGSGKTYFLRKLAHEATKLPNTIPIYFYLSSDALLFEALSRYVNEVREYVRSGKASIHVVGFPGAWAGKVSVLERCLNECAVLVVDEVDKFLAVMSCLEKNGYRPLVVFDEIERVIFGDALKDERTFEAFVPFFTRFIELIRPSRFHGVVVIATTYSVDSLIDKALWEAGRESFINKLSKRINIDLVDFRQRVKFPMIVAETNKGYYDARILLKWDYYKLRKVRDYLNLKEVSDSLLSTLSRILPTPRCLIQMSRALRMTTPLYKDKLFYSVIKDRLDLLIKKLKQPVYSVVDGRVRASSVVTPLTRWHELLEKLLKEEYIEITPNDYLEIAKLLGMHVNAADRSSLMKAKSKVSSFMSKLISLGFYERFGKEIVLNSYFVAYLLGIDKLPDGSDASLNVFINKVIENVRTIRKRR